MTDAAAFLNAIKAAPEDDAPRLVYADYLDERGDDASASRAALIRGQIEYARLGKAMRAARGCCCDVSGHVKVDDADRCAYCRADRWRREWGWDREPTLLLGAMDGWFMFGVNFPALTWDRGFIAAVACEWAEWLGHVDDLLAREWVPRVVLTTQVAWRWHDDGCAVLDGRRQAHWVPRGEQYDHSVAGIARTLLGLEWPQVGTWELPDHSAYTTAVAGADIAAGQPLALDANGNVSP